MPTLPPKILFSQYALGGFEQFVEDVYAQFKRDFMDSPAHYRDHEVRLKKHPLVQGMHHTFYHMTHDGPEESNRQPSIPRMECMPYPRALIDQSTHPNLKVWSNTRHGKKRILIYHSVEKYLVVLEQRQGFVLLWTAYPVSYKHTERKLLKEWSQYIKQGTPTK